MAIPLSLVTWEQDGFLRVKVKDEEASLSQVQKCSPGNAAHIQTACLRFQGFCYLGQQVPTRLWPNGSCAASGCGPRCAPKSRCWNC